MRPLSSSDLLQIWEWGEDRHPIDRAMTLLTVACPDMTHDQLAALSIGQRDALLFSLRGLTFGPRLYGFAECSACGERLEFTVDVAHLLSVNSMEPVKPESVTVESFEVQFRLPNSLDLAEVAHCDDVETARNLLMRRCVLQARQDEAEVPAEALPERVIATLAAQVVACDPLSEVQLDLHCPECGHHWPTILDIVSFFWSEISAQVKRLLPQVHILARAYGWREADILAMSARRRQLYLEMVT